MKVCLLVAQRRRSCPSGEYPTPEVIDVIDAATDEVNPDYLGEAIARIARPREEFVGYAVVTVTIPDWPVLDAIRPRTVAVDAETVETTVTRVHPAATRSV